MMSRRRLLSLAGLGSGGVALAQVPVQTINGTTQVRNVNPPSPYDNWVPVGYAGAINGINNIYTIGTSFRKVEVYLNGDRQAQSSDPQVVGSNVTVTIGTGTITFIGPTPVMGDNLTILATL